MLKKFFGLFFILCLFFNSAAAKSENFEIDGDHGKLSAILQTPDGKKNFPLVILCHGFNADKNYPLIKFIADDLEKIGIASIRFDFNGHGESEGNFQDMTVLNEIEDAKKIYDFASKISGVTSISMAGHSQGGIVSSMIAGELGKKKIKSVALMASAPVLRDDTLRGYMFRQKNYNPLDPPEYVEINTPYGKKRVGKNFILTLQTLPIYETSKKFTGSVLILHSKTDILVPYTYSLHYHELYKNSELKILDGLDHGFSPDTEKAAQIVADFFAKKLK